MTKNPMILAIALAATAIPFSVCAQAAPAQETPSAAPQETQTPAPGESQMAPTPQAPVQQSAAPKAGDTIYDNAGEIIGPIDSVNGAQIVVVSAKGKATIPAAAVAPGAKGLMINMTKAQFETAVAAAHATKTGT